MLGNVLSYDWLSLCFESQRFRICALHVYPAKTRIVATPNDRHRCRFDGHNCTATGFSKTRSDKGSDSAKSASVMPDPGQFRQYLRTWLFRWETNNPRATRQPSPF